MSLRSLPMIAVGSLMFALGCSSSSSSEGSSSANAVSNDEINRSEVTSETTDLPDGSSTAAHVFIRGGKQRDFRELTSKVDVLSRSLTTWEAIPRSHLGSTDTVFKSVKLTPAFRGLMPGMKVVATFPKEQFTRSDFSVDLELRDIEENKAFTIASTSDFIGTDGQGFGAMDVGGWTTRIVVREEAGGLQLDVTSTVHLKRDVAHAKDLSGFARAVAEHFSKSMTPSGP